MSYRNTIGVPSGRSILFYGRNHPQYNDLSELFMTEEDFKLTIVIFALALMILIAMALCTLFPF